MARAGVASTVLELRRRVARRALGGCRGPRGAAGGHVVGCGQGGGGGVSRQRRALHQRRILLHDIDRRSGARHGVAGTEGQVRGRF